MVVAEVRPQMQCVISTDGSAQERKGSYRVTYERESRTASLCTGAVQEGKRLSKSTKRATNSTEQCQSIWDHIQTQTIRCSCSENVIGGGGQPPPLRWCPVLAIRGMQLFYLLFAYAHHKHGFAFVPVVTNIRMEYCQKCLVPHIGASHKASGPDVSIS